MKRFLLVFLSIILILGVTTNVLAVPDYNIFYYETIITDDTNYNGELCDWTQTSVTAEVPMETIKLGFDYSAGTLRGLISDYDIFNYKLKGGLALTNSEQIRIDVTAGYFNGEYQDMFNTEKITYDSLFIGFDAKLYLSYQVSFDINYAYGINPEVKTSFFQGSVVTESDMNKLALTSLRLNLHVSDETGLSVGYIMEDFDSSDTILFKNIKNTAFTIGAFYRF